MLAIAVRSLNNKIVNSASRDYCANCKYWLFQKITIKCMLSRDEIADIFFHMTRIN